MNKIYINGPDRIAQVKLDFGLKMLKKEIENHKSEVKIISDCTSIPNDILYMYIILPENDGVTEEELENWMSYYHRVLDNTSNALLVRNF